MEFPSRLHYNFCPAYEDSIRLLPGYTVRIAHKKPRALAVEAAFPNGRALQSLMELGLRNGPALDPLGVHCVGDELPFAEKKTAFTASRMPHDCTMVLVAVAMPPLRSALSASPISLSDSRMRRFLTNRVHLLRALALHLVHLLPGLLVLAASVFECPLGRLARWTDRK